MTDVSRLIRRAAAIEILRIALFLVYYLLLIALGAAILCGTVIAVRFLLIAVLPRVRYIRAAIALVVAAAGFGALALMFGFYLVKPVFSFTRDRDPRRLEVRRSDCPALFALIDALAGPDGVPPPKARLSLVRRQRLRLLQHLLLEHLPAGPQEPRGWHRVARRHKRGRTGRRPRP